MSKTEAIDVFQRIREHFLGWEVRKAHELQEQIREEWIEAAEPHNPPDFEYLGLEVMDRLDDAFKKEVQETFDGLSPDERIAIFQHLVSHGETELYDCYMQRYPDTAVKWLLFIQLVKQVC